MHRVSDCISSVIHPLLPLCIHSLQSPSWRAPILSQSQKQIRAVLLLAAVFAVIGKLHWKLWNLFADSPVMVEWHMKPKSWLSLKVVLTQNVYSSLFVRLHWEFEVCQSPTTKGSLAAASVLVVWSQQAYNCLTSETTNPALLVVALGR